MHFEVMHTLKKSFRLTPNLSERSEQFPLVKIFFASFRWDNVTINAKSSSSAGIT